MYHYIIYKITNKLDGKFYIGKHKTKNLDDGYMGSGKLIQRAIKKYGVENFKKEILHVFKTEAEMNEAEARLVVLGEDSYNLCPGGHGGFGYINNHPMHKAWAKAAAALGGPKTEEGREAVRLAQKKGGSTAMRKRNELIKSGKLENGFKGKTHNDDYKAQLRVSSKVIVICQHCGKEGSSFAMKRWHGSNCKMLCA